MGLLQKHRSALCLVGLFIAGAILYSFLVPNRYEISSRVVVHRDQIESPGFSTEASKNRWIWVRDGYAIQDSLLSESFLFTLLQNSNALRTRYEEKMGKRRASHPALTEIDLQHHFLRELKKSISVEYLGGDSFTYILTARDQSPAVAKEIVQALIVRLRHLVIDETKAEYAESLAALTTQMKKSIGRERLYIAETYRGLLASSVLFDAGAARRVEVVQEPSTPLSPVWPRLDRLLIFALILGLASGLILEYALAYVKQNRVQHA